MITLAPQMQILGKVRRHHFTPEEKRSENLRGKKNSYLENILMGKKFGLGEGAAEGSCLSSR